MAAPIERYLNTKLKQLIELVNDEK